MKKNFYWQLLPFSVRSPDNNNGQTRAHPTVNTTYFISDDSEYEINSSFSRYIDYIYAEGRIVALHVHNITANADSLYYVQTDLLGSWDRIVDNNLNVVQSSHFDPWGNRMSTTDWTLGQDGSGFQFRRGFTGHEHYDRFGIINMNARLYDPVLGRFFSPDPQVQSPYSTQGLNRYSYCGNNPVMSTDPDGEFIVTLAIVAGLVNRYIHKKQGDVTNPGAGWGYFTQGFVGGLLHGISWVNAFSLMSIGSPSGMAFINANTANIISTSLSMFKDFTNASRILLGRYYFDENMGHGFTQALTRYTRELPQTWVGYNYSQFRNLFGSVDRVDYLGGATFATDENNGTISEKHPNGTFSGITIGNYINMSIPNSITGDFQEYAFGQQIYLHEYGHTIQSQILGMHYLLAVGLPSLISAGNDKTIEGDPYDASTHDYFYTETWANRNAFRFFFKHYGYVWNECRYPLYDYR